MTKINVTKSFLPPLSEYVEYLEVIWKSGYTTNQGPLLIKLENQIKSYTGVADFQFVNNGTTALQIALKALNITEGEIITTPFSYVATTSAILWERCTPVFVDIERNTFCIDAGKIEDAITPNTKAILAVHVFGVPCDVEAIERIASKHNLKVIYDAAHAFGVVYKGRSLLSFGDISICSFHATKLFNTVEGGAVISKNSSISQRVEYIKRFGHQGDDHFMLGINAKASELHAAMGLCNLKYIDQIIKKRKKVAESYDKLLDDDFIKQSIKEDTNYNYSYFPIVFKNESQLLAAKKMLEHVGIYPRRYFYPSLNLLPYIKVRFPCPISEDIASRILCLPLYPDLAEKDIKRICSIVNRSKARSECDD